MPPSKADPGGVGPALTGHGHESVPWAKMSRSVSVWVPLSDVPGFLGFGGNFNITLLPTYLKNHRHLDTYTTGWLTSLPFGLGVVGCRVGRSISDAIIRRWGTRWGRRLVGMIGMAAAGLAIPGSGSLGRGHKGTRLAPAVAFFGNDLAMAPAWAAAADIGGRYTGVLSGAMNMASSFMAAVFALWLGQILSTGDLVQPFVILAVSYALGSLTRLSVDVTKNLWRTRCQRAGEAHRGLELRQPIRIIVLFPQESSQRKRWGE